MLCGIEKIMYLCKKLAEMGKYINIGNAGFQSVRNLEVSGEMEACNLHFRTL